MFVEKTVKEDGVGPYLKTFKNNKLMLKYNYISGFLKWTCLAKPSLTCIKRSTLP